MSQPRNAHLTYRANTGVGRHGWLRLTPAYSVALVRDRVATLPAGSVVTDPFSGTGTTALAAAEHGHRGQALDVNPFLVWLGNVKTRGYPAEVRREAQLSLADVDSRARSASRDLWQPPLFRIERWWSPGALQGLKALRSAIDDAAPSPDAADLYDIALCRTLIATSNAAFDHQSMSFTADSGARTLFDQDDVDRALRVFEKEATELIDDAQAGLPGSGEVVLGDSRCMADSLPPCDLLLTSPPYVNRMSYIRELRPYMYWLRYLDLAAEAGELDWQAIGGTWGSATSRLASWATEDRTPVEDEMSEVRSSIVRDGGRNGPLLSNYVGRYFHDMWRHFTTARDHVKPGGLASYIVGNSTFYGHVVPAEQWYATMLRELGFVDVRVTTIRKRNSNKHLYEFDVSGRRP